MALDQNKSKLLFLMLTSSLAFNAIIIGSCSTPVILIKSSSRKSPTIEPVELASNQHFQEVDENGTIAENSFIPMKPILEVTRSRRSAKTTTQNKPLQALFVEEIVIRKKPRSPAVAEKFNYKAHRLNRQPAYVKAAHLEQSKTISKLCLVWSCFLLLILYGLYILERKTAEARIKKTLSEIYNL